MKLILGVAMVILVALLGSKKTFTRIRIPLAAKHLYLTGTEYILVGWCLGSQMLGILDSTSVRDLSPLIHLALGWIGLMFGSQLDITMIRRFPGQYFQLTVIESLCTIVLCFIPMFYFFQRQADLPLGAVVLSALAITAIAVPTGQSSLTLVLAERKLRRRRLADMLSYVAGMDLSFGLVILAVVFCFAGSEKTASFPILAGFIYLAVSVGMGAVMGLMLHVLTRLRCSQEELLLFTIGVVVFSAGAAAYLGISPLFVTATGGVVIANNRGAKERILRALITLEKPFYIVVLIVGGALLDLGTHWQAGLLLTALFVITRFAGKFLGGFVFAKIYTGPVPLPANLGLGLMSQGGIAAAMALGYFDAFKTDAASLILVASFLGIILNEIVSPALVKPLVQKEN